MRAPAPARLALAAALAAALTGCSSTATYTVTNDAARQVTVEFEQPTSDEHAVLLDRRRVDPGDTEAFGPYEFGLFDRPRVFVEDRVGDARRRVEVGLPKRDAGVRLTDDGAGATRVDVGDPPDDQSAP